MKNIEKYIVWLIVLTAISFVLPFIRDIYLAQQYGSAQIPLTEQAQWKSYIAFIGIMQNFVAAIWLVFLAKAHQLNRILWGVFGLTFGLLGVGLFYLVSIYEHQKT